MPQPLLSARDLRKSYGSGAGRFDALNGVSIDVTEGESLAVVGKSGSGKSTLLHLLGVLDRPDSGSISYRGDAIDGISSRRADKLRNQDFGFVFQGFHLDGRSSVFDNVSAPLAIAGSRRSLRRKKVEQVLDRLGLVDRIDERAGNLSGGQKQRVAIARALINEPVVLFADEPTGALDSTNGEAVASLLFEINAAAGITIVLVTHSAELAARCTRQIELMDGKLEATKQADEDALG